MVANVVIVSGLRRSRKTTKALYLAKQIDREPNIMTITWRTTKLHPESKVTVLDEFRFIDKDRLAQFVMPYSFHWYFITCFGDEIEQVKAEMRELIHEATTLNFSINNPIPTEDLRDYSRFPMASVS